MVQLLASSHAAADTEKAAWSTPAILVVSICFLINMIDGMDVLLMSYLAPAIAEHWQLAATSLGVVFSGGLVGMAIGGLLIAPFGDRYGRRRMILGSLVMMCTGMVFCGVADSITELVTFRVMVGAGIGTALACMAALVAEFAPPRRKSFAVGLLQGGYPIGATATGFLTAWALRHSDWQPLFVVAGIASACFIPVVWFLLPESREFLSKREPSPRHHIAVSELLSPQHRRDTLLLWSAIFFGFMVLYFIVSWIPRLSIEAGLDQENGIYAGAIYNVGAFLGTVALAWMADRLGLRRLIVGSLLVAAGLLLVFGIFRMPVAVVLVTSFALGVSLQGGFNGLYPLSTYIYPVEIRSTGLGWAMGLGRAGAVIGPLLGGYILSAKAGLFVLFATFAIPLFIAALCTRAIRRGP